MVFPLAQYKALIRQNPHLGTPILLAELMRGRKLSERDIRAWMQKIDRADIKGVSLGTLYAHYRKIAYMAPKCLQERY